LLNLTGLRLLLVLPQLPQDPASGAARSTRTMCEMLAAAGAEVRALATTASERFGRTDTKSYLRDLGIDAHLLPGRTAGRQRPELEFIDRGIHYHLLDVGRRDMHAWQKIVGSQFDILFDRELQSFSPDILLAFGGLPGDVRRFERARRQQVRIVFALRNEGYLNPGGRELLSQMEGVLTPSQYLTDVYRTALGVESTPLPLPMELEDVVAPDHDPIFFTMINPAPEKGLMVMARLAEELSLRRPNIPLLIVESRGSAGKLVSAGLSAGFDLRRHENVMMSPAMAQPKEIYLATRALLAPSLWQEPAGRVAAEALLNGIPPLVSDRGGLPETCNGAGFYLPIPPEITPKYPLPVAKAVVEPWVELMIRLESDEEFYRAESQRALEAGAIYRPENLAPRYVEYFNRISNGD
jgi:glycosyltransferase involved in cell wall biosynthesis